ncbi:MAG: hypothetical protein F4X98_01330 [Gammaproteobacteria bacterium]|nr:hypothetical protein [Gammaproteobacteria bacterium]
MRRTLLIIVAVGGLSHGQEAEPLRWALDEFRTRCIPLWGDVPNSDCTVAEFGEVAELDGSTFYFAVYDDRSAPVPDWATSWSRQANAVVLFRAERPDLQTAIVLHVRKPDREYGQRAYRAPELLRTDLGPVFYLQGYGSGDGSFQFQYDEYWLWRSGSLVALDVHGWLYPTRERMPSGFSLKGIGDLRDALQTLRYVSGDVARDGDGDCCPTGGTVSIRFEWDGLSLRVADFEHDPGDRLRPE